MVDADWVHHKGNLEDVNVFECEPGSKIPMERKQTENSIFSTREKNVYFASEKLVSEQSEDNDHTKITLRIVLFGISYRHIERMFHIFINIICGCGCH